MKGATLTHSGTEAALTLDGADITGSVHFDEGFSCSGRVCVLDGTIGGSLSMTGATLTHTGTETRAALALDRTEVGGSVALDGGFSCAGQVRMNGAAIGSELVMRGAVLTHAGSEAALCFDFVEIMGSAFFDGGFRCAGQVRMPGATIGGQLVMTGATLTHTGTEETLLLDGVDIENDVLLCEGFSCAGQVRMRNATIGGELVDDVDRWPAGSDIAGSAYNISIGAPLDRARWSPTKRIVWLGQLAYASSAYRHLADQYRQHGFPTAAEDVLIAMRSRRRGSLSPVRRGLDWLFEKTVGYGLRPIRLVITLSLLVILVWGGLSTNWVRDAMATESAGLIVFADGDALSIEPAAPIPPLIRNGCGPTSELSCYEPLIYGLDTMLPLVDFNQDDVWRPDTTTTKGRVLDGLLAIGRLLGWVLAAAATVSVGRFIQDNRQ